MSSEASAASVSTSWSPLTTIVVAIRSALSAIALVAVFDRQFVVSKWLHWALRNWSDVINVVFGWLPFRIPEPNRPFLALVLIILGTVTFDFAVRRRGPQDDDQWKNWRQALLVAALLLVALAFGPLPRSPSLERITTNILGFTVPTASVFVGGCLLLAAVASPRMFLWLAAFTAAFIGLNEIALLFEQNVPLPPT